MSQLSRRFRLQSAQPYDFGREVLLGSGSLFERSVSRFETIPLTRGRMDDQDQAPFRLFSYLFGLSLPQQEVRDLRGLTAAERLLDGGDIKLTRTAQRLLDKASPNLRRTYTQRQETRREALRNKLEAAGLEYDSGKILSDIAEMELNRQRTAKGPSSSAENSNLPLQRIYDKAGNVLLEGRAASKEDLISVKLEEAAQSTDPKKRVVNLDGADLSNLHLKDMKLSNLSMKGASIKGTTIENCTLQNVDMTKVEGDEKTKIKHTAMYCVDMTEMSAPGITIEHVRGAYINMARAHIPGAKITDMRVENLWAVEANMDGATIGSLSVTGPYSNLDDLKLNNAKVSMSHFGTEQQGIPMRGLQAVGTTWSDVNFHKSMLDGGNFAHGSFTRVNMENVTTKTAPMNFYKADITGLRVGPQAELTADLAIKDGITLRPVENFVFKGTAPLDEAVDAAILTGRTEARIVNALGDIEGGPNGLALDPQVERAQLAKRKPLPTPLAMPSLIMKQPWEKRG